MKRTLIMSGLACLMVTAIGAITESASAQQQQRWIPQTREPNNPYTYTYRVRGQTRTIPYWQAYGPYVNRNRGNMTWPKVDTVPRQNRWSGFYFNQPTFSQTRYPTFGRLNSATGLTPGYRPIQSNPRSNSTNSSRRVYVKLRR